MRLRKDPAADGPTNMAADLALLQSSMQVCRLYEWSGPWVTLGRFQQASRDLLDLSLPHIVRPTGGKAVLHGHDWTVGMAAPLAALGTARSVKQTYRLVAQPIIEALRACGIPAALAEETAHMGGPRVADCFAHVSANDVVDAETGRKVCGCALRVTDSAVLMQASIPRRTPAVLASSFIRDALDDETPTWDDRAFPSALEKALAEFPLLG